MRAKFDSSTESALRILVVEDHPVSRELIKKYLTKAGYVVVLAENGREAFEVLQKEYFPVVITDWMMPEMDGLKLCRKIREHDFPGYVFVVILTARDSKDEVIAGLHAGVDEYLTKPLDRTELLARLNTAKRILELERSLKKRNQEISLLSTTDPLTGVFNRIYLNEHLPREIKETRRYSHSLSLVMCDIDHFKKINDLHGHLAGDMVLRAFADCLRKAIRDDVDWIVRYGGEEFLVVMPHTDLEGACAAAERLRRFVSAQRYIVKRKQIKITASFGVASISAFRKKDEVTADALVELADKCLYQAKRAGRNAVSVVGEGPT